VHAPHDVRADFEQARADVPATLFLFLRPVTTTCFYTRPSQSILASGWIHERHGSAASTVAPAEVIVAFMKWAGPKRSMLDDRAQDLAGLQNS
jgi:hypothetical protein